MTLPHLTATEHLLRQLMEISIKHARNCLSTMLETTHNDKLYQLLLKYQDLQSTAVPSF
jgi:hypothetical protein